MNGSVSGEAKHLDPPWCESRAGHVTEKKQLTDEQKKELDEMAKRFKETRGGSS